MTDPTTILREAITGIDVDVYRAGTINTVPLGGNTITRILATRIPQACQTCKGSGVIYDLRCDNCGGSASLPLGMTCSNHLAKPTPCPDCPTILDLLLWGWERATDGR